MYALRIVCALDVGIGTHDEACRCGGGIQCIVWLFGRG